MVYANAYITPPPPPPPPLPFSTALKAGNVGEAGIHTWIHPESPFEIEVLMAGA